MKRILAILTCVLLFASFTAFSTNSSEIVDALKANNATQVSKYFDSAVDFKLPGKDEVKNVSKNQATQILKSFYSEQDIKSFELTSKREMAGLVILPANLRPHPEAIILPLCSRPVDQQLPLSLFESINRM
ncbi:DUF4783 domain-containing protein [Arachidicoccus ginsenosidivorans]|nr:DUF4783 domain-containing protein [Arachidicoccus ginsenosidivorans]